MNRINLIPPRRRWAKARRRLLRAWAGGVGAYAALLAAAGGLLLSGALGGSTSLHPAAAIEREKAATQAVADAQRQLVALRTTIARSQQSSIAAAAVTDSPDFSRLLAVVAHSLGSEVALDQCSCAATTEAPPASVAIPLDPNSPRPQPAPVQRNLVLNLSGYGRSQAAVADFVLRLEGLGVFQQVQLLQTTQMATTDGDVVWFNLKCPLRGVVEDPS
jgi:Tfp pilus assembly protein PilN